VHQGWTSKIRRNAGRASIVPDSNNVENSGRPSRGYPQEEILFVSSFRPDMHSIHRFYYCSDEY